MAKSLFYYIFKTARPQRWIRNFSLFAALIFSSQLLDTVQLIKVTWGAIIFSLLSAGIYFFNDIIDIPLDRRHPFKKKRPIASGKISLPLALFISATALFVSLSLAWLTSYFFFIFCFIYVAIQIIYTLFLKKISIIDVLAISTGFVIRVYAGAVLIDAHLSVWFLLCVTASALLLAVGKRKAEISLLAGKASQVRAALGSYPPQLLDAYVTMFALFAIISYILFSFNFTPLTPSARLVPFYIQLPRPLFIQKWLMITIPVVIYGIMRYLQVIYQKNEGESPERILLQDKPLLFSVVFWVFLIIGIIYIFPN